MKIIDFIKKLQRIEKKYGDDLEVIMADDIPVVSPIFSTKYHGGNKVVITDQVR
jgi:hypothetical protein